MTMHCKHSSGRENETRGLLPLSKADVRRGSMFSPDNKKWFSVTAVSGYLAYHEIMLKKSTDRNRKASIKVPILCFQKLVPNMNSFYCKTNTWAKIIFLNVKFSYGLELEFYIVNYVQIKNIYISQLNVDFVTFKKSGRIFEPLTVSFILHQKSPYIFKSVKWQIWLLNCNVVFAQRSWIFDMSSRRSFKFCSALLSF